MSPNEIMNLATAAMSGNAQAKAELREKGYAAATIRDLHDLQRRAYDAMSPAERRRDLASTERALRLARARFH